MLHTLPLIKFWLRDHKRMLDLKTQLRSTWWNRLLCETADQCGFAHSCLQRWSRSISHLENGLHFQSLAAALPAFALVASVIFWHILRCCCEEASGAVTVCAPVFGLNKRWNCLSIYKTWICDKWLIVYMIFSVNVYWVAGSQLCSTAAFFCFI